MSKVIIIEDEVMLRELLVEIFKGFPQIQLLGTYGDGMEGWNQCQAQKPDLVILDMKLPSLNGLEILRHIKSELPATRVLLFSGIFSPTAIKQALQHGVDGIIEKASGLSEMTTALSKMLQGEQFYGSAIVKAMSQMMADPQKGQSSVDILSDREREVLQLIAEGYSTKEIGVKLNISPKTAETHRTRLMEKLDLHGVADLTRFAISQGLVEASTPPQR